MFDLTSMFGRGKRHLCSLVVAWRPHIDFPKNWMGVITINGRELALYLPRSLPQRRRLPYALAPGDHEYVESLLLRRPAVLGVDVYGPSRRELLICHCGDFSCGCVSVEIRIAAGQVSWSRFAYHTTVVVPLKMGELHFDLSMYESVLRQAVTHPDIMAP